MLEIKELQHKSLKELHEILREKRAEVRKFRFSAHENQLKNVRAIRNTRGEIARILTAIGAQGKSAGLVK